MRAEHAYERGASLGAKHAQGARYKDSYACGAIEYAHGACGARTVLGMRVQYGVRVEHDLSQECDHSKPSLNDFRSMFYLKQELSMN